METVAAFFLPSVVVLIIGYGFVKKCRVFDVFLEGAKGGFRTALNVALRDERAERGQKRFAPEQMEKGPER